MDNKLREDIKNTVTFLADAPINRLYLLIEDVACEFDTWRIGIGNETTHLSNPEFWDEIDKHSWKLKPAKTMFTFFINNVYKPKKHYE